MDQSKANASNASVAASKVLDGYCKAQNALFGDHSALGRYVHDVNSDVVMTAFGDPEVFKRFITERGDLIAAHVSFVAAWDGSNNQPQRCVNRTTAAANGDIRDAEADYLMNPVLTFLKGNLEKIGKQPNLSFLMGIQIFNETQDRFLQQPIFEISLRSATRWSATRIIG